MTKDIADLMKRFKVDLVREDGRIERLCKHDIGHTVGHVDPKQLPHSWIWIHGCDGCCEDWETDMPDSLQTTFDL